MNGSRHLRRFQHRRPRRVVGVAAAAILVLGACSDDTTSDRGVVTDSTTTDSTTTDSTTTDSTTTDSTVAAEPSTTGTTSPTETAAASTEVSALSDDEIAGLLWMREEEQLAHDVYTVLGDQWGLQIFDNIADSESMHVGAVADLLDRYGLVDPAVDNEPGTFDDPTLQDLYDQLVVDGSGSLVSALQVGALIEELDLVDLQARSAQTDEAAIVSVYANLEKGSRNHLRAFVSELAARGVTYEPTRLDQAAFDAIVSSEIERGPGGG
jgi:hypothetical protein